MTYSVPDMSRQPKLGRSRERFDVVVIGAGQAGLALGCFLARAGRRFADGSELDVDAVVWATGYRADYSWLTLPALDEDGRVRHRRGVTEIPGLYLLGLSWQHTRGSALLGWVKDDAEFIADQLAAFADAATAGVGDDKANETVGAPQSAPLAEGV